MIETVDEVFQPSENFLAERSSGIGGSDAHHVHSAAPYGCARRLYYEKTGTAPDDPDPKAMTAAMRRGLRLEDIAVDYYQERYPDRVIRRANKVRRHAKYPQLLSHLDRTVKREDGVIGVLEAKTVGEWMYRKIIDEGPADRFLWQGQHSMMVTGYQFCAFAIYWADGDQLVSFDMPRNEALIAKHQAATLLAWTQVQDQNPPARLDLHTDEHERCKVCPWVLQCHGPAMEALTKAHKGTIEDPSLLPLIERYRKIKPLFERVEAEMEAVKKKFRIALRDRIQVYVPNGSINPPRVDYKPQFEWDVKRLEVDRPDLLERYTRREWNRSKLSAEQSQLAAQYKISGTTRPLKIYLNDKESK